MGNVCLCCAFYDAWSEGATNNEIVARMVQLGKKINDEYNFDNMVTANMQGVACELFKEEVNYGRIIAFLVYAVTHFPNEKKMACQVLQTMDDQWQRYFKSELFTNTISNRANVRDNNNS